MSLLFKVNPHRLFEWQTSEVRHNRFHHGLQINDTTQPESDPGSESDDLRLMVSRALGPRLSKPYCQIPSCRDLTKPANPILTSPHATASLDTLDLTTSHRCGNGGGTKNLLTLPFEIRHIIWTHLFRISPEYNLTDCLLCKSGSQPGNWFPALNCLTSSRPLDATITDIYYRVLSRRNEALFWICRQIQREILSLRPKPTFYFDNETCFWKFTHLLSSDQRRSMELLNIGEWSYGWNCANYKRRKVNHCQQVISMVEEQLPCQGHMWRERIEETHPSRRKGRRISMWREGILGDVSFSIRGCEEGGRKEAGVMEPIRLGKRSMSPVYTDCGKED